MISQTIKSWNANQGRRISLFIYQDTTLGVFQFSNVEAEVKEELDAISWLCLSLAQEFRIISRIEVAAISGLDEHVVHEHLDDLINQDLLEYVEYNADILGSNINRLNTSLSEEWKNSKLKNLMSRSIIRQYQLTEGGKTAVKANRKIITTAIDLNLAVSGSPFLVYNSDVNPRANTYNDIPMTPDITSQVISLAKEKSDISGINPIGLNSSATMVGKSINQAQVWVGFFLKNGKLSIKNCNKQIYLTSTTFDRWSTPKWDESILDEFPDYETLNEIVVAAISKTYEFDQDIIAQSLKYLEKKQIWQLEVDLEMIKLINERDADLIKYNDAEVSLNLPETRWKVATQLSLEPYYESEEDTLAFEALIAGRFHALATRKGFTHGLGFELFKNIMEKWKKKPKASVYQQTLENLVKYGCLTERFQKIEELVVDLDNLLSTNRRDSQTWQFNRIRQLDKILNDINIPNIQYVYSSILISRIDEEDSFNAWKEQHKVVISDGNSRIPEVLLIAAKNDCHYLGNRSIPKNKDLKNIRKFKRQLNFEVIKNVLRIKGLEVFYEWRMNNLFEEMYKVYY